eukprot:tig00000829_g4673.t1
MSHTILLIQPTSKATRTWSDHETVNQAMDSICQMFEGQLKRANPSVRNITYDISELFQYIDSLADLSVLVFNPQLSAYQPHNKDWIKKRVFQHLQSAASA